MPAFESGLKLAVAEARGVDVEQCRFNVLWDAAHLADLAVNDVRKSPSVGAAMLRSVVFNVNLVNRKVGIGKMHVAVQQSAIERQEKALVPKAFCATRFASSGIVAVERMVRTFGVYFDAVESHAGREVKRKLQPAMTREFAAGLVLATDVLQPVKVAMLAVQEVNRCGATSSQVMEVTAGRLRLIRDACLRRISDRSEPPSCESQVLKEWSVNAADILAGLFKDIPLLSTGFALRYPPPRAPEDDNEDDDDILPDDDDEEDDDAIVSAEHLSVVEVIAAAANLADGLQQAFMARDTQGRSAKQKKSASALDVTSVLQALAGSREHNRIKLKNLSSFSSVLHQQYCSFFEDCLDGVPQFVEVVEEVSCTTASCLETLKQTLRSIVWSVDHPLISEADCAEIRALLFSQ